MDLSVQQLRMLREVAARGTMAAAAESLGYTPSAVSQQLAGLERTTGVAVLERVGRNVRLTDAGRELVHHAAILLADLEIAQTALERVTAEARGTVEISAFESVASVLMAPLLQHLAAAHPDLVIRTRQVDPDVALELLLLGELDLAFVLDYPHAPGAKPDGIDRELVCHDWFRVVVPADDPVAGQDAVVLADLADRTFVSSPPDLSCGRCVVQACRDAGFEPDVRHQIDDYPATLRLVAAGAGIALMPDLGLFDPPGGVRLVNLADPVCRTLQLAYRTTSAGRPGLRAVCEAVGDVARALELDVGEPVGAAAEGA